MVVLSDDEADAAPAPEVKRGAPPDSQPLFGDEELEPEALCADAPLDEPMETDGEGKGTEDVVLASPTGLDKIEDASEQEFTAEDKRQPLDDPKANAKSHMFEEDDTDSLAVKKLKEYLVELRQKRAENLNCLLWTCFGCWSRFSCPYKN